MKIHPRAHFCTLLWNLQERWARQCRAAEGEATALSAAEQRRALWVAAPEAVQ